MSNIYYDGHFSSLQAAWQRMVQGTTKEGPDPLPMPSRLVTEEDLKPLYKAMMIYEASNVGVKRKGDVGSLDTQHYGRGKRAREVCLVFILLSKRRRSQIMAKYFCNLFAGPLLQ